MRGRKPAGPEIVERLQGSQQAKKRLRVILEVVMGQRRIPEACRELGIGEVRFNEVRHDALEGALAAVESKPKGRPPRAGVPASAAAMEQLLEQIESLQQQLRISQIREEVALARVPAGPESPAPVGAGKKTAQGTARGGKLKRSRT